MGLRCSLLGHDFGEPETEEDREERGDEVVVTVREIERCSRCSEGRVVSENTEVRAIEGQDRWDETVSDPAADPEYEVETDSTGSSGGEATHHRKTDNTGTSSPEYEIEAGSGSDYEVAPESSGGSSYEIDSERTDARSAGADPDAQHAGVGRDDPEVSDDTDHDGGAMILDEDGTERDPEEWFDERDPDTTEEVEPDHWLHEPESGTEEDHTDTGGWVGANPTDEYQDDTEPAPWPDQPEYDGPTDDAEIVDWPEHDSDDEGFDAEPGSGTVENVEFDGMTPRSADQDDAEVDPWTPADGRDDTNRSQTTPSDSRNQVGVDERQTDEAFGLTKAESSVDPADLDDDVPTEIYCPECGLAHATERTSQRPGDICPECRSGYLAERPR